jgi:hypothetical protein
MSDHDWSQCGGLKAAATETLTALIGLEVLFQALAMTKPGRDALHGAMDERLHNLEILSRCGVGAAAERAAAAALREMVDRVAPAHAAVDVAA